MSDETTDTHDTQDEPRPDLAVSIMLSIGLPEMNVSRIIRAHVITAIVTALLQQGILTKEQLAEALSKGQKDVQQSCAEFDALAEDEPQAAEMSQRMSEGASELVKRLTERYGL